MRAMKKIPYQIEINISQVPNRLCRFYQEQINDYYADGRARYEWDRIKQNYILKQDPAIEQICGPCPLNILLDIEGCRGDLYDFDIFLKAIALVKPESILMQKNTLNAAFTDEETAELIKEMEGLQEQGQMITWPVAQVFNTDGTPVTSEGSQKHDSLVYFEWLGDDEESFFTTNKGYHLGVARDGIIVKKNYGETLPEAFLSLSRKGFRVVGQTVSGKVVPIPLNRAKLPEWFPDNPEADTDLKFSEIPITHVFQDIFNMIIVYAETALQHYTGINIFSEFYRRA